MLKGHVEFIVLAGVMSSATCLGIDMLSKQKNFPECSDKAIEFSIKDFSIIEQRLLHESPPEDVLGLWNSHTYQDENVILHASESCPKKESRGCLRQDDYVVVYIHLCGISTMIFDGYGEYIVRYPEVVIAAGNEQVSRMDIVRSGDYQAHIAVCLQRDYMLSTMNLSASQLPGRLADIFRSTTSNFSFVKFPLSQALYFSSRSFFDAAFTVGSLSPVYYRAKIIELISLLLEGVRFVNCSKNRGGLNERKTKQLNQIRSVLHTSFGDPHTLESLAASVGMSKAVMTASFKTMFGMSVFECLLQERMNHAYDWLKQGRFVTEVAELVGYEHPPNFSLAFRRYYGFPPSVLQKINS